MSRYPPYCTPCGYQCVCFDNVVSPNAGPQPYDWEVMLKAAGISMQSVLGNQRKQECEAGFHDSCVMPCKLLASQRWLTCNQ